MNGNATRAKIPWTLGVAPLDADRLLLEAAQKAGPQTVDREFETALKTLVQALNEEAELGLVGQMAARQHLRELLETRFRLLELWQHQPAIQAAPVLPQIFLTGLPKTGSTFLHRLLALDPDNRVPRMWEVMLPLPPPDRASAATDDRIRRAQNRLRWLNWIHPKLVRAHPVGAALPQECGALLGYTLESSVFLDMFTVPSYESWLRSRDLGNAYRFHAQLLQHLQWHSPADRWVLKSSDHLYALKALLKTYPEALFVFLHRDPLRVLQAACSQMALLKRVFSRQVDFEKLGGYESGCLHDKIELILEFRASHPQLEERIVDVRYQDLAEDPVATVRRIYERFGLRLTDAAAARMAAFAAAERGGNRTDTFPLGAFSLDPDRRSPHFELYRERFALEREELRDR
ncbi:sulfotransferase family protein [Geomesophilobacter sediminis]|uniref:Sulfotransferase n=1 Tax=Geomesophilobacter sediminis TaxID=2798584 RepID=A0A8J7J1G9_9BACT|nr:sulfotransferase [Geomesophilobacter sediminis]MBJ6724573.1 sulfotransferase [Geomesophilobacter sediminis]